MPGFAETGRFLRFSAGPVQARSKKATIFDAYYHR